MEQNIKIKNSIGMYTRGVYVLTFFEIEYFFITDIRQLQGWFRISSGQSDTDSLTGSDCFSSIL